MYNVIRCYFFGDEKQKKDTYFRFILPYFDQLLKDQKYHIRRDWNGGPNYKLILPSKSHLKLKKVQLDLEEWIQQYAIDSRLIDFEARNYQKTNQTISVMERMENKNVTGANHGKVILEPYEDKLVRQLYHSHRHFVFQTESLFKIQQIINKHQHLLVNCDGIERAILMMKSMYSLLKFSLIEDHFAVLTYFSHSEGVLAQASQYGKRESMEQAMIKLYNQLPMYEIFQDYEEESAYSIFLKDWEELFSVLLKNASDIVTNNELYEDGYFSKKQQYERLQNNIFSIDSSFHKDLIEKDVNQLFDHDLHHVYRLLVNVLYQAMHMIDITFKERTFYCYALSKICMEQEGTSWQDILEKRRRYDDFKK